MKEPNKKFLIISANEFYCEEDNSGINLVKSFFDKNNIPQRYQKIIVEINIPLLRSHYEAQEFTQGVPFDLTAGKVEKIGDQKYLTASTLPIYNTEQLGKMKISFKTKLDFYTIDDIVNFMDDINASKYLVKYLLAIKEVFNTNFDINEIYNVWNKEKNGRRRIRIYKNIVSDCKKR